MVLDPKTKRNSAMSYVSESNQHHFRRASVPFAEYTESFRTMGEAVYDAFDIMVEVVVRVGRAASTKMQERKAANMVSELSDHTLEDIGVHRSEIRYVAARSAANPEVDYRVFRQ